MSYKVYMLVFTDEHKQIMDTKTEEKGKKGDKQALNQQNQLNYFLIIFSIYKNISISQFRIHFTGSGLDIGI